MKEFKVQGSKLKVRDAQLGTLNLEPGTGAERSI
jgi:hypothetical protein